MKSFKSMHALNMEFWHASVEPPFSVAGATAKSSISCMATKTPTMEPELGHLTNRGMSRFSSHACPIASQTTTSLWSHLLHSRIALTNVTFCPSQRNFQLSAATVQIHHNCQFPTFNTPFWHFHVTIHPGICTLIAAGLDIRFSVLPCRRHRDRS